MFIWNKSPNEIVYANEMSSLYSEFDLRNYIGYDQFISKGYYVSVTLQPNTNNLSFTISSGSGKCNNVDLQALLWDKANSIVAPDCVSEFAGGETTITVDKTSFTNTMYIVALSVITNAAVGQPSYQTRTDVRIVRSDDPIITSMLPLVDPSASNRLIIGKLIAGSYTVDTDVLDLNIEIRLDQRLNTTENVISITYNNIDRSAEFGQYFPKGLLIAPSVVLPGYTGLLLTDVYEEHSNALVIKFNKTMNFTPGISPGVANFPIITTPIPHFANKTGLLISKANPTINNTCMLLCDDGTVQVTNVPVNCPIDYNTKNIGYSIMNGLFDPLNYNLVTASGLAFYKSSAVSGNAYYLLGNNTLHYQSAFL